MHDARRTRSRLPSLGPRGEGWVALQVPLLLGVLAAGPLGPRWSGPAVVPLAVVGGVLGVAGLALATRGWLDLGTALTALPAPRGDARLVERGAYGLVRHPMYGGLILGAAGYALVLASPLALAGAGAILGFFRLKSGLEERWLRERYPGYAAYAARTRRFIPWLY